MDPRELLSTMTARELRDLAAGGGFDAGGRKGKRDLVEFLASQPSIESVLAAKPYGVKEVLGKQSVRELKALAGRLGVDASGCRAKGDYVALLAASGSPDAVLQAVREVGAEADKEGRPAKAQAEAAVKAPPPSPLDDPEVDPLLAASVVLDVDFRAAEELLDQARMRYEERNFEKAAAIAARSLEQVTPLSEGFLRASWAYAILSAQRLIEDCGRAGRDVEEASDLLRRAKRLYGEAAYTKGLEALIELTNVARNLYSAETRNAREELYAVQDFVAEVSSMGSDVNAAEDLLFRAREVLKAGEYARFKELLGKARDTAQGAREKRIREIEEAIPITESIVEEAKYVGADVAEALKLLEQARIAYGSGDYILANELTKRAERYAMETQKMQIERALELRRRQVEKAQALIASLEPLLAEGQGYGIDIAEPTQLLQQAREVLDEGDYVNGTLLARQAENLVRKLEPRLVEERRLRGLAPPPSGVCGQCGSRNLQYSPDGSGQCLNCGRQFRWRKETAGVWTKFRKVFTE